MLLHCTAVANATDLFYIYYVIQNEFNTVCECAKFRDTFYTRCNMKVKIIMLIGNFVFNELYLLAGIIKYICSYNEMRQSFLH